MGNTIHQTAIDCDQFAPESDFYKLLCGDEAHPQHAREAKDAGFLGACLHCHTNDVATKAPPKRKDIEKQPPSCYQCHDDESIDEAMTYDAQYQWVHDYYDTEPLEAGDFPEPPKLHASTTYQPEKGSVFRSEWTSTTSYHSNFDNLGGAATQVLAGEAQINPLTPNHPDNSAQIFSRVVAHGHFPLGIENNMTPALDVWNDIHGANRFGLQEVTGAVHTTDAFAIHGAGGMTPVSTPWARERLYGGQFGFDLDAFGLNMYGGAPVTHSDTASYGGRAVVRQVNGPNSIHAAANLHDYSHDGYKPYPALDGGFSWVPSKQHPIQFMGGARALFDTQNTNPLDYLKTNFTAYLGKHVGISLAHYLEPAQLADSLTGDARNANNTFFASVGVKPVPAVLAQLHAGTGTYLHHEIGTNARFGFGFFGLSGFFQNSKYNVTETPTTITSFGGGFDLQLGNLRTMWGLGQTKRKGDLYLENSKAQRTNLEGRLDWQIPGPQGRNLASLGLYLNMDVNDPKDMATMFQFSFAMGREARESQLYKRTSNVVEAISQGYSWVASKFNTKVYRPSQKPANTHMDHEAHLGNGWEQSVGLYCTHCHNNADMTEAPEDEFCLTCHHDEAGVLYDDSKIHFFESKVIKNPHDIHLSSTSCTECHDVVQSPQARPAQETCDDCHDDLPKSKRLSDEALVAKHNLDTTCFVCHTDDIRLIRPEASNGHIALVNHGTVGNNWEEGLHASQASVVGELCYTCHTGANACGRCHDSALGGGLQMAAHGSSYREGFTARSMNPKAYHAVDAAIGKDSSCNQCHEPVSTSQVSSCQDCHDDRAVSFAGEHGDGWRRDYNDLEQKNLHGEHVTDAGGDSCLSCHSGSTGNAQTPGCGDCH
ncbi:MAG: cytochrome c3 family protein [bacterium]